MRFDMAKPTDDEIVSALQDAGSTGMTIAQIGAHFGVPWQSLTGTMNRLDADHEPSRRVWCELRAKPPIWRAVGYTAVGGKAKEWLPDIGGWREMVS
jgi:hypothetical protein